MGYDQPNLILRWRDKVERSDQFTVAVVGENLVDEIPRRRKRVFMSI